MVFEEEDYQVPPTHLDNHVRVVVLGEVETANLQLLLLWPQVSIVPHFVFCLAKSHC